MERRFFGQELLDLLEWFGIIASVVLSLGFCVFIPAKTHEQLWWWYFDLTVDVKLFVAYVLRLNHIVSAVCSLLLGPVVSLTFAFILVVPCSPLNLFLLFHHKGLP